MRKKITFLLAALLLLSGLSWAQQITWSAADQGYENGVVIESVDFNDYVAGEFFKGTNNNAPKYYTTGAAIRCYGGNYFTITSDYVLTEISFGFASGEGSNAITSNVGTYEDGTWTGSANEVTFTISGTSGHRRFATFTITYDEGGNPAPSITANNVEIAYDATEGAIEYTINNYVEGGVLTASTEAEWLTIGTVGETVPFTSTVNDDGEREATITLTYTYNTDQTVTKNVTVTQANNPNAPGTENNPYTVAQARAAIDAGTGTQGVYATGIVSAIPTAYNPTYSNITFNMVDEEGDEVFLQAYRCGGEEAANVAIGDVVVVYGNLTKYGSTYEFGQGCTLVSLTHPAVAVEAPTFNPEAGTFESNFDLTISCATDGATIYYTTDGTEPNSGSHEYTVALNIASTTTIKAIAYDGTNYSTVATATYHINSAGNAYTVTEALNFPEYQYPANGIYVHGIVSTAPTQAPTDNGELTYFISLDGEATNELEVYKGKGLEQAAFNAQDDIQVGDIVTIYGNVVIYTPSNGDPVIEFASGNYLVDFERPVITEPSITIVNTTVNVPAEEGDGTIEVTYNNINLEDLEPEVQFFAEDGVSSATYDWIDAEIDEDNNVYYVIDANTGEARNAYFKVFEGSEGIYSNLVTINQAEYVAPALDYAELPFEFNGGKADIENTDGLSQNDLGSDYNASSNPTTKLKFDGTGDWLLLHFIEAPDTLKFDIKGNGFSGGTFTVQTSEDGTTYTDLATYTELTSNVLNEEFTDLGENVRYIKWIYTEKASGNVGLGNIMVSEYEEPVLVPSITLDQYAINVEATSGDGIISVVYENFTALDPHVQLYDADGAEVEPEYYQEWISVFIGYEDDNVHYGYEANTTTENRTVYFKVYNGEVYSELATITQAGIVAPEPPTEGWVLTSLAELTEDDVFVIVGNNGSTYAMSNNNGTSSAPAAVAVTIENDALTQEPDTTIQWTLNITGNGYNFYPYGETETWLFCNNGNNGVRVGDNTNNVFVLDETTGYMKNIGTERYLGIYNSQDWRCYTNTTGNIANQTFAFYKKVAEPAPVASITVTPENMDLTAEQHYIANESAFTINYENIVDSTYQSFTIHFYDGVEGEEIPLGDTPWHVLGVTGTNDEGYQVVGYVTANEGDARTAYFKVSAQDANGNTVYSNLVTINQAEYVAPEGWVLTSLADLTENDVFVIVGTDADTDDTFALPNNATSSAPAATSITVADGLLTEEPDAELQWNISGNATDGYTFYPNGVTDSWLYCNTNSGSGNNNNMRVGDGARNVFTLDENGYMVTNDTYTTRYLSIYNNQDWRGYVNTNNNPVAISFYKKSGTTPPQPQPGIITVTPAEVVVDANEHDGTLTVTYENITEIAAEVYFCNAEGEAAEYEWIQAEIDEDNNVYYMIGANEGEARTAYMMVYALDDNAEDVYSNLVTINQDAYVAPVVPETWVLTDFADLMEGDVFVIVGDNGATYAMANDNGISAAPAAVGVLVVDDALYEAPAANLQWNLSITENGYVFYPNGETETWLYCTNTNNGVRVGGTNNNNVFVMDGSGYLKHVSTGRYIGIYASQDWRCYTNTTGNIANQTFAFYKKVAEPETYTLDITGYGNNAGGYYLIASPVYVNPETTGMTQGDFDLYYFDQNQDEEWRNYEVNHFNLVPGKGYLYAHKTDTILNFTGTPYSGNGQIALTYDANADFAGWNLIGNPFGNAATIDKAYYRLNEDGSEVNAETQSSTVALMEGVFVKATEANQTAQFTEYFSKANQGGIAQANIMVIGGRGSVIDKAIVRFDNGETLEKFQLHQSSTKVYFTEGVKDYAIVRSANEGEIPVSFKAENNGTYTFSVNAENINMMYLHLIDNMTGADVDLLAMPSYSFEARTTDYANRFRLVFSANDENGASTDSETFAFFNGSEWSISNMGAATLQVIDVTGRILSSENVNGNATISLNETPGVYVFRLVNGDSVKTQKVVVK